MMITLDEIEAGDLVHLVDQPGNTASGTVLLDATRGRLCIRAFGIMLPLHYSGRSPLLATSTMRGSRRPHRRPAAGGRLMPGPVPAMSQGQTVALLMAAARVGLLCLVLTRNDPPRPGGVRACTRSALEDALLLTAGLALLLVRRLDPAALSRVLADVTAVLVAAATAERCARWLAAPHPLHCVFGQRADVPHANRPSHDLPEELS